jgi:nucleotide-binding universal stress UspA family protein
MVRRNGLRRDRCDMTASQPARSSPTEPRVPDTVDVLLVPIDGSDFSRAAVPTAARLGGRLGAEIHLLSAVESVEELERGERELARVDVPGHRVHRTVLVDRDPAGAIHEALRKLDSAVACMATHGRARSAAPLGSVAIEVFARGHDPLVLLVVTNTRSWTGIRRLVFGSVAATIVRHSPSPVLVVPRADRDAAG